MSIKLGPEAQAALEASEPVLVLGGPGSGKTTLSLLKAQRIIPTLSPGQEVLFLSFSRAAVRQVMVRCKDVLTRTEQQAIRVRTYHSFCMELLKSHGRLLNGRPARILYPAATRMAKAAHRGDWEVEQQRLAREDGLYCFDQFAPASVEILGRAERVLRLVSQRYPVIILDEFQDTDDAQWGLVQLLGSHSRLIVLADPDQRIFEYDIKVDPERLNQLHAFLKPAEFDLGNANHRSPDASILSFADAVLRNRPLPQTDDVVLMPYLPATFKACVHAATFVAYRDLVKMGIRSPTIALLCRSNQLVVEVSAILDGPHTFGGTELHPIEHDVVWDAELTTAAAQVVGSILEWPEHDLQVGVAATLQYITHYYELKNSIRSTASAQSTAVSYRKAEEALRNKGTSKLQTVDQLISLSRAGLTLVGRAETDWLAARAVVAAVPKLREIFNNVRFVRLFRAKDEIGGVLGGQWLATGTYGQAAESVRKTLEAHQLISANSDPAGIVLMSMHKSKGKEFDGVVMVEGRYSGKFFDSTRESEPFEATRRLLRVAITRARHKVFIVRPQRCRALTDS